MPICREFSKPTQRMFLEHSYLRLHVVTVASCKRIVQTILTHPDYQLCNKLVLTTGPCSLSNSKRSIEMTLYNVVQKLQTRFTVIDIIQVREKRPSGVYLMPIGEYLNLLSVERDRRLFLGLPEPVNSLMEKRKTEWGLKERCWYKCREIDGSEDHDGSAFRCCTCRSRQTDWEKKIRYGTMMYHCIPCGRWYL